MYNFDYEIKDFTSDEEYQKEFLTLFGMNDIMDDNLDVLLNNIYSLIVDNDDWKALLTNLCTQIPFANNSSIDMGLSVAFSYTYIKQIHECLREYKNHGTTTLVQEFNKTFEEK